MDGGRRYEAKTTSPNLKLGPTCSIRSPLSSTLPRRALQLDTPTNWDPKLKFGSEEIVFNSKNVGPEKTCGYARSGCNRSTQNMFPNGPATNNGSDGRRIAAAGRQPARERYQIHVIPQNGPGQALGHVSRKSPGIAGPNSLTTTPGRADTTNEIQATLTARTLTLRTPDEKKKTTLPPPPPHKSFQMGSSHSKATSTHPNTLQMREGSRDFGHPAQESCAAPEIGWAEGPCNPNGKGIRRGERAADTEHLRRRHCLCTEQGADHRFASPLVAPNLKWEFEPENEDAIFRKWIHIFRCGSPGGEATPLRSQLGRPITMQRTLEGDGRRIAAAGKEVRPENDLSHLISLETVSAHPWDT
jgi:hypothetical protein